MLKDKIALVTGAGRGIGIGIARKLAEEGASVVVHYNNSEEKAKEVVRGIEEKGGKAAAVQANLEHHGEVRSLVEKTVNLYGGIDILVNNAAFSLKKDFFEITEEDWNAVVDANLKAVFFASQSAARSMKERGGGKIINISSVHSHASSPRYSVYAASKGGVNALTRGMAIELADYNINVNSVAPGVVEVERYLTNPEYDRNAVGDRIPLGRVGMPEDIAEAVLFLASHAGDYITGQVLFVDGGQTSRLLTKRKAERVK